MFFDWKIQLEKVQLTRDLSDNTMIYRGIRLPCKIEQGYYDPTTRTQETDPEYSVEDYLNAVTANLILNIGPEPINTPLHQNWIHRRTALIQTSLVGAAQKWFQYYP